MTRSNRKGRKARGTGAKTPTSFERGLLARYFVGAAAKELTRVEVDPEKSHQHEFQGVSEIRRLLGDQNRKQMPSRFVWIADDEEPITEDGWLTWYNARQGKPRSAEFHLYYPSNSVTERMGVGDVLFFALGHDGSCTAVITPAGATAKYQLLWLFGLDPPSEKMKPVAFDEHTARLAFAARYILDELDIEVAEPEPDLLDRLLQPFGRKFPTTREFSKLARDSLANVNPSDDPDGALIAWIEREELLFRRLERRIVSDRLIAGFATGADVDVDGFLKFSLHVQNRRKSRAGRSLENHLEALFSAFDVQFCRGAETENHNKPDFLFPGISEYRNKRFPALRLTMLGAKSTCKDR